jgi:chorismate mutase
MDAVAKDILDSLDFIKDRMATKDDVAELRSELKDDIADVRREMATKDALAAVDAKVGKLELSIYRELDEIKDLLRNLSGFRKEIDHALECIAAIERHFGMQRQQSTA